jgi:branched-chain amino acid transport system ATP-binding protein
LSGAEVDQGVELIRAVRARGVTVVVIEHVMQAVASLTDRVIALDHGEKIVEGPFESVVADPRLLRAYFGERRARQKASA